MGDGDKSAPRVFKYTFAPQYYAGTADSNTALFLSTADGIGYLDEYLAEKWNIDKFWLARAANFAVHSYAVHFLSFVSHEDGHETFEKLNGNFITGYPDPSNWTGELPAWKHLLTEKNAFRLSGFQASQAGLYQNNFNAEEINRIDAQQEYFSYDHSIGFLENYYRGLIYNLMGGHEDSFDSSPDDISQFLLYQEIYDVYGGGDVSKNEWAAAQAIAGAATFKTWLSLYSVGKYLFTGDRMTESPRIDIGWFDLSPPIFTVYSHPDGLFLNANLPVHSFFAGNDHLTLNYGSILRGNKDGSRFGSEYEFNPYGYINWTHPTLIFKGYFDYYYFKEREYHCEAYGNEGTDSCKWIAEGTFSRGTGFYLGADAYVGNEDFQVGTSVSYSDDDMYMNDLKQYDDGFLLSTSVRYVY